MGSSAIYELFKIPYIGALGSLGISWYVFREGKETFEKAKTKKLVAQIIAKRKEIMVSYPADDYETQNILLKSDHNFEN